MFSADTDVAGNAHRLNFTLSTYQYVNSARVSPNGYDVVYGVASSYPDSTYYGDLYRVGIGGGASIALTVAADHGYGVRSYDYQFTPDGSRLVYIYQQNAASPISLQSANPAGGPINRVDLFVDSSYYDTHVGYSRQSADSQWVVFTVHTGGSYGPESIYSVPPTGGNPTLLTNSAYLEGISPDSTRVLYRPGQGDPENSEIYSQQIFGGAVRDLTTVGSSGSAYNEEFSPDGLWMSFLVELNGGMLELRVSDGLAGGSQVYLPQVRR